MSLKTGLRLALLVATWAFTDACAHPSGSRKPRAGASSKASGVHLRLLTPKGPVHVYRPRGFDPTTAGTLVYVHGYYTDLDTACRQQRLADQFQRSHLNALFISPEAPAAFGQPVRWDSLEELLEAVRASGVTMPSGAVVAMAHSGGFRTVVPWLSEGLLDTVVLLDGLYGNEPDFQAWVDGSHHRLVLVGDDTKDRVEQFVANHPDVEEASIPLVSSTKEDSLNRSRLVFVRSQVGHMQLVTEGQAIPQVLRLTELPLVRIR